MPSKPNPIAVAAIQAKTPIGSPLNTSGWEKVPIALRESAQFSATIENLRFLQRIQDRIETATKLARREGEGKDGGPGAYQTKEKFMAELQAIARDEGLTPEDLSKIGGLQDPTSLRRLGLIWDTQIEKTQEFAKWKMDQDPDVLNAYPAQEFIRVSARKKKRTDWPQRWKKAFGGRMPRGRYVALKTDPGWAKLSRFGTPWPPFDFGSGMGLRDISRRDAIKLGLMKEGERIEPIEREFNDKLEASVKDLSPRMQNALKRIFGDQVSIEDGVAKWNNAAEPPPGPQPPPLVPPAPKPPIEEPKPPIEPPIEEPPLPEPPAPAPPIEPPTIERPPTTLARESTAQGSSVSRAAVVEMKTQKQAAQVKRALGMIDNIHGDGPLTPIPINNKIARGSGASYYSTPTRAVSIGVRRGSKQTEIDFAHEVGHWIDNIGMPRKEGFGGARFASHDSPLLDGWRSAVENSQGYKDLLASPYSGWKMYALKKHEVFARSYAQFVAEESGLPDMLEQLKRSSGQWTTEDFAPIREELSKTFRSLGWMK